MGFNDETSRSHAIAARDLESGTDVTRRDALARNLCARICDERKGVEILVALDHVLTHFENEDVPPASLMFLLESDRYAEGEGNELEQQRRIGWNRGMAHATALVRAFRGMDELRRQSRWPDTDAVDQRFDLGGEAG